MAGEARPDAQLFQLLSDLLQQVCYAHARVTPPSAVSIRAVDSAPAAGRGCQAVPALLADPIWSVRVRFFDSWISIGVGYRPLPYPVRLYKQMFLLSKTNRCVFGVNHLGNTQGNYYRWWSIFVADLHCLWM
jgi:hypothetical protein